MSEKGVASDSGIELSRKSKSGSGSFAGVDTSFNDFDSGQGSRRGTYDDDDDDDYIDPENVKVNLDAFMGVNEPAGDDVGDEDGEEEEDGSEDEDYGDEEDEGEYETDEEGAGDIGPSDEILTNLEAEMTPRQYLQAQKEHNKEMLKNKKKKMIREYLRDIRHFNNLRAKNFLLGLKIITHVDQKAAVIEKYMQQEREEEERQREADLLKKKQMEKCANVQQDPKKKQVKQKYKKRKEEKRKSRKHARFSASEEVPGTTPPSSSYPSVKVLMKRKFNIAVDPQDIPDISLNKLSKQYLYNIQPLHEMGVMLTNILSKGSCKRNRYLKDRIGRKLKRFSFMRTQFLKDAVKPKEKKPAIDLMNINIDNLRSKSSKLVKGALSTNSRADSALSNRHTTRAQSRTSKSLHSSFGIGRRKQFAVTKEARGFARSKTRMALDHHKQEQTIRLHASAGDGTTDLHHFKFEFADPRLTAKQVSMKLRNELIKLLQHCNISTTQLKWPLEVKGVEFDGKNPYGRVTLNYTKLSSHEREMPHTAYRILLTNMAYLRSKLHRMGKRHNKNLVQLEQERSRLESGLKEIFTEIVEGLRIMTSLCGVTDFEKKEARRANEIFNQELDRFYNEFLTDMLVKLYQGIHSCEFALRKLWISEGKGEGAELHEFKDIMRGREKLKAEHKNIEKGIARYQKHSNYVLKTVKHSGKRLHDAQESIEKMDTELEKVKKNVWTMIEGMYFCMEAVKKQRTVERKLKCEAGILSSPALADDFQRLKTTMEETISRRLDLQRRYNGKVRDIQKLIHPTTRFVRYKLRS